MSNSGGLSQDLELDVLGVWTADPANLSWAEPIAGDLQRRGVRRFGAALLPAFMQLADARRFAAAFELEVEADLQLNGEPLVGDYRLHVVRSRAGQC